MRQTDARRASSLNASRPMGAGHNNVTTEVAFLLFVLVYRITQKGVDELSSIYLDGCRVQCVTGS